MHKLLRRQLVKAFGSDTEVPEELARILDVVDAAYQQADLDRLLLERSLDLTSHELLEANRELRMYASDLEQRVAARTAELRETNKSLELEIAERTAAEKAVGESEERYRSLFESSKDAIYISTPGGKLIDINPAGLDLFGFASLEEILEVDVAGDLYRRPEDRRQFLAEVDRVGFVRDGELDAVRKDGEVITILATTAAVCDDAGEVVAYRGILRDVTDQRRLELELLQAQKMEAVGRLAGGVAHDFNNLLTAILAYCDRLSAGRPDDDDVRSCAEAISTAAERGSELTSQLLAFGRRQVLRPLVLDLNRVISEMQGLLRRVIPEDVEIVLELDPDLRAIKVDRAQIEQVIVNLAINAGDAMSSGGRLTIRTATLEFEYHRRSAPPGIESGTFVHLAIEDTGVGIDESVRDQIFEPFFTTKSASRGTGLGLAMVYSAVRQCRGHVEVTSEVGSGTQFDIYLPMVDEEPESTEPETLVTVPTTGTESLLIVEDDPSVRRVLEDYLEDRGFTVIAAADGEAGLELARREGIRLDLVLTDVVMPKMNGIDLARCLREELPHIKILLISGHTTDREKMVDESLHSRSCSFLQKPFTPDALARSIRELLDA